MVTTCLRQVDGNEVMYTVPFRPHPLLPELHDPLKVYEEMAGSLTVQKCGLEYTNGRGMWLCRQCALKAGWIW